MAEGTKRPWAIRGEWMGEGFEIFPVLEGPPDIGEWAPLATVHECTFSGNDEAAANAALIVRAVNERDALLKAEQVLLKIANGDFDPNDEDTDWLGVLLEIQADALAALSQLYEVRRG